MWHGLSGYDSSAPYVLCANLFVLELTHPNVLCACRGPSFAHYGIPYIHMINLTGVIFRGESFQELPQENGHIGNKCGASLFKPIRSTLHCKEK
jgi:hypothetical protein